MCIPAEAAPTLSSSSCYPLVNFSRPFCQNHGITLPSYVYGTPEHQINRNSEINKDYDFYVMLGGASKVSHLLHEDINRVKKCIEIALIGYCRYSFPRCDETQSVFKRQKICRESCLKLTHICGKLWKLVITANKIRPMGIEMNSCELQPYRNAGDSPECWYMNTIANSTGNIILGNWWKRPLTRQPLPRTIVYLVLLYRVLINPRWRGKRQKSMTLY